MYSNGHEERRFVGGCIKKIYFYFQIHLAVQKERDRLGRQRSHHYNHGFSNMKSNLRQSTSLEDDDDDDLSVMALLRAEQTAQEVITEENKIEDKIISFLL